MRPAVPLLLLTVLVAAACDDFPVVQKADTIEAYEKYVAEHPGTHNAELALDRLEMLYLREAKERSDLALYDKYLERFPEGKDRARALEEREELLYLWAKHLNTVASWQKYIDDYPKANPKRRKDAENLIAAINHLPSLAITPPNVARVNLAEDPEGPLNGWGVSVEITNQGEQTIKTLMMTLDYLDANDRVLSSVTYPAVIPEYSLPLEDFRYKPLAPGKTVAWDWTTGDPPVGWANKVRVYPSRVDLVAK